MPKVRKIKQRTIREVLFFENNTILVKENIFEDELKKYIIRFYQYNPTLTHVEIDKFSIIPIKLYTINQMKKPVVKKKRGYKNPPNYDFFK